MEEVEGPGDIFFFRVDNDYVDRMDRIDCSSCVICHGIGKAGCSRMVVSAMFVGELLACSVIL